MAQKHNSIKRIIHRTFEELKATCDIAKSTSLKKAIATLRAKIDIQIMNRNGGKETEAVKNRLLRKHQIILDFLEKQYAEYWGKYHRPTAMPKSNDKLQDKIWVCWWQGLDNAPDIVKVCINSIIQNAGEKEVIIITEDNYHEYVTFPEWVEEKRKAGIISRTIYSDLLRMNLLSKYGGIWIDSTFFCTKPCFEEYMRLPLWSIKRPDYLHCSVAGGYFANYSLGCNYGNRWIFKVIFDFLCNYWKENDKLVDYLLTDYVIVLAQRHDKEIAEAFAKIQPNNKWCDELNKVLNAPFDENTWQKIGTDTCLYKLTWKQTFSKDINGKETFFGKLINGKLS